MGYKRNITPATLRQLYANSGNECAMYNCSNRLIYANSSNISEVCHIEAINEDGARYNPNSNNEEVNSYNNLILLCPTCHAKVDNKFNVVDYPVEFLKKMRDDHETRIREAILEKPAFNIPMSIRNIDVSKIINFYNSNNEEQIKDSDIYKAIEKILDVKPALRSIMFGIIEQCNEYNTHHINMPLVCNMSNVDEYTMASILKTLTDMKYIQETQYVNEYQSMVEDAEGNVHFVNDNFLFKLINGTWELRKKGKLLMFTRKIINSPDKFYNVIVNKNLEILENTLR